MRPHGFIGSPIGSRFTAREGFTVRSTAENFGRPGVTDYRNPLLAEAMKVLGYVQRFGMGIPLARKELQKNGNPPLGPRSQPECRARNRAEANVKTIAFFNNKGGVGKTSLAYHLASMYADLGLGVVAADLDPQANLSSMFLPEDRLEELWPDGEHPQSILGAIRPILKGTGDIADPHVEDISDNIGLIVGDLGLSTFEDKLSDAWPRCHDRDEAAFRVISAFYRVLHRAAHSRAPNSSSWTWGRTWAPSTGQPSSPRSMLPFRSPPTCSRCKASETWDRHCDIGGRSGWSGEKRNPDPDLDLPSGDMVPAGYVVMQHAVRLDRPVQAYSRWMDRIPAEYQSAVLDDNKNVPSGVGTDPNCLAQLKHYRSLMPMAMEARKPMFFLKPADGAIGAHTYAVQECYKDFKRLAERLAKRVQVPCPVKPRGVPAAVHRFDESRRVMDHLSSSPRFQFEVMGEKSQPATAAQLRKLRELGTIRRDTLVRPPRRRGLDHRRPARMAVRRSAAEPVRRRAAAPGNCRGSRPGNTRGGRRGRRPARRRAGRCNARRKTILHTKGAKGAVR